MTSKENVGLSSEGGGPAHNTTLDVLHGRLPGADQTSSEGLTLREPGEQRPEGGPRNRATTQEIYDSAWVNEVLGKALAVRLDKNVLPSILTTTDKAVAECLATLSFDDMEAAAALLQSPRLEEIHGALLKLLKTPKDVHSLHKVRLMVGVWLTKSAAQHAAVPGQHPLHDATQSEPPAALGSSGASAQHSVAPGYPHLDPDDLLGSSQQPHWLGETIPRQSVGSLFGPQAVAGGPSSYTTNLSSTPPALVAEGAVQRAGFCGTAPTDAPQGSSSAVQSTPHHVGAFSICASPSAVAGGPSSYTTNLPSILPALFAEGAVQRAGFCGTVPTDAPQGASSAVQLAPHHVGADCAGSSPSAVAGGPSSYTTNISSNISAPTSIGSEGAASRVGFYGSASAGASYGSSLAARAAPTYLGAGVLPHPATLADEGVSYLPYSTNTPSSEVVGRLAPEPRSMDLPHAFQRAPCQSGAQSHAPAPAFQAARALDMTPFRPEELAGRLEGVASPASAGRMGSNAQLPNAQLLDTAALVPASVFQRADVLLYPTPRAHPAKSFPGINHGLEAEPSRNLETSLGGSVSTPGGQNFVPARAPYQPEHLGSSFAAGPHQRSRLPTSGAPPEGAAPMVIRAGEEAQFYVYDSARTLSVGSPAIGLLSSAWLEAGLAMRVGTVDSQGLALVWAKNNTHNFLALSPSPQALLDAHGVGRPESWLPRAEHAAAIKLPPSMAEIQSLIQRLPTDGWMAAVDKLVGMAAEEDTDLELEEIASVMVNLHYTNPVLNGATVLFNVDRLEKARLAGYAGHTSPSFRDAFLGLVNKLRRIAVATQLKQRQPAPATSVRFLDPRSGPDSSRQFVVDVDSASSGSSAGVLSQRVSAAYPDLLTPLASY